MTTAVIEDIEVPLTLLDSGADVSLVSAGLVDRIAANGSFLSVAKPKDGLMLHPVGQERVSVERKVRFPEVTLKTSAGPLRLRNLECWIHEGDQSNAVTIGRPTMMALGYSTDGLLVDALKRVDPAAAVEISEETAVGVTGDVGRACHQTDPAAAVDISEETAVESTGGVVRACQLSDRVCTHIEQPPAVEERVRMPELADAPRAEVKRILDEPIHEAKTNGLPPEVEPEGAACFARATVTPTIACMTGELCISVT